MTGEAKRHTEEYRKETADYAISCDKSVSQVARELGINQATLNRWVLSRRRELELGSNTILDVPEVKELRKRVAELEMENEFLKKRAPSS